MPNCLRYLCVLHVSKGSGNVARYQSAPQLHNPTQRRVELL